jgi:hypothetical protein
MMRSRIWVFLVVVALGVAAARSARAETHVIYVAPKDSAAAAAAPGRAGSASHSVQPSLHRALTEAAEIAGRPGARTVHVFVVGGEQHGALGSGVWALPTIDNPEATVRILGGFDDAFAERSLSRLTRLTTERDRTGPLFGVSQGSKLRELVVSGFVLDAGPSNAYASEEGSLQHAGSRSPPLIAFAQMHVDRLVVSDCALLNAAEGGFEPVIAPLSHETTVEIANNLFVNDLMALKVGSGIGFRDRIVRRITVRNNSFLRNWPYNPDTKSSNVGALDLNHKGTAREVVIEGNLFAHNPGGALQHNWPVERMPKLTIRRNLFFRNATLFEDDADDAGVVVGKFGALPTYRVFSLQAVTEHLPYEFAENVSLDPGLGTLASDLEVGAAEDGDENDVSVRAFAPRFTLDLERLPVPQNAAARAYGVQADALYRVP